MDTEAVRGEIRERTELSFSRAGGPGGQNVNKRDTKVTAKLAVADLEAAGDTGRERIRRRLAGRINAAGQIVLQAAEERTQEANRRRALLRMEALVTAALKPDPKPRRATRPSRAARERRLAAKKRRSAVKNGRGGGIDPED